MNIGYIVALWRVAIIVRAVAVLTDVSWLRVLPLVLAPAALEALVGSFFQGLSLVGIMGGVRLEPHTELLVAASHVTTTASLYLFIGSVIAHFFLKPRANYALTRDALPASGSLFAVALGGLAIWVLAAIPLHPPLANRHRLDQLLKARNFPEAAAFASRKTRGDFPPHHYLPPAPSPWFDPQLLLDLPADAPAWLRDEWVQNAIESRKSGRRSNDDAWQPVYARYPEVKAALARHAEELRARGDNLNWDERHWLLDYEHTEQAPADAGLSEQPQQKERRS